MSLSHAYQIKKLVHYYGDKKVLDIENFSILKGNITGLQGPNGSGKTTLLKLLAFTMKPCGGQIFFNGKPEVPFSPRVRSRVTLMTQKSYLLKRTVFDNIVYGLKIRNDLKDLESRVRQALSSVGLDYEGFAQRKWHQLSGGETQRVAMAARLILKPAVLLLDEPVAGVDAESAVLIRRASLNARNDWGTTLIIASHDLQWLYECSDTQISISQGTIFSTGEESIIPGPYDCLNTNSPVRPLGGNRHITLSIPDKDGGTAVIQKDRIFVDIKKESGNGFDNQVYGEIVSMHLKRQTNHIMTTITIQDLTFILSLDNKEIESLGLCPGKKVVLKFKSQDIQWR